MQREWPDWRVTFATLDDAAERFDLERREILLDLRQWPEGEEFARCHALAHLDWGHAETPGDFKLDQESIADWVATLRLDKEAGHGPCTGPLD